MTFIYFFLVFCFFLFFFLFQPKCRVTKPVENIEDGENLLGKQICVDKRMFGMTYEHHGVVSEVIIIIFIFKIMATQTKTFTFRGQQLFLNKIFFSLSLTTAFTFWYPNKIRTH